MWIPPLIWSYDNTFLFFAFFFFLVEWSKTLQSVTPWPQGYKTFFVLSSAENKIFSANKYENANHNLYLLAEESSCSAMFSMKEFATSSNLTFIN